MVGGGGSSSSSSSSSRSGAGRRASVLGVLLALARGASRGRHGPGRQVLLCQCLGRGACLCRQLRGALPLRRRLARFGASVLIRKYGARLHKAFERVVNAPGTVLAWRLPRGPSFCRRLRRRGLCYRRRSRLRGLGLTLAATTRQRLRRLHFWSLGLALLERKEGWWSGWGWRRKA